MTADLPAVVDAYLTHKRGVGRKFDSEQAELTLLARFADQRGVNRLDQLSAGVIDDFLASRPRTRPRSFNHLLGVITGLLNWAVTQEMLDVAPAPLTRKRRGTADRLPFLFDRAQARRLLDTAAALPDNPRALHRGPTYRTIYAICYGLGLRAGEACGLRIADVDVDRGLLVVRGGKLARPASSRTAHRSVNCCTANSSTGNRKTDPPGPTARCSPSTGGAACTRARPARPSITCCLSSTSLFLTAWARRGCIRCGIHSPWDACCAGIGKGSIP